MSHTTQPVRVVSGGAQQAGPAPYMQPGAAAQTTYLQAGGPVAQTTYATAAPMQGYQYAPQPMAAPVVGQPMAPPMVQMAMAPMPMPAQPVPVPIPDPESIAKQKDSFMKMLDDQHKQTLNVLDQQLKYQIDMLHAQAAQEKQQFNMQVD